MLLTCAVRQTASGEFFVMGDDAAERVAIEDIGHGEVSVLCQDRGGDASPPRLFTGVTSLIVNLAGGDDRFEYLSVQDVNAALPLVEVSLGDGNDVADLVVELHGTPDRTKGFEAIRVRS